MASASKPTSNGSGNNGSGNNNTSSTTTTSSARATKKSAFSCEPCRRRKVKCGGEQPICSRCLARNDACIYKLNPTLSYTQRLEERIKDLEDQLAKSQAQQQNNQQQQQQQSQPSTSASTPQHVSGVQSLSSSVGSHPGGYEPGGGEGLTGTFRGLKLDERGVLTYHGATSFFHLPSDYAGQDSDMQNSAHPDDPLHGRRERLVNNAWQQRALEDLSEIPEPFQYLLNTHWCWIQPLFNFIYRPAFTRDMQLLGPYYSHTLLNAILSHSVRWGRWDKGTRDRLEHEYDGGAVFSRHARTMVFDEVSRGVATIPTVQTLLLLSAQECSQGNTSQAWMYSGMAFRMIDHLGICVDSQRYTGDVPLSDEDIEIRRRLFWSCYFWDKIISLYLGRSPSLQQSTVSPPQLMLDDSNENEMWAPFGLTYPDGVKYPPIAAHSTSCFMRMCQLSVIFNQILIHMYDPMRQNSEAEMEECLAAQEAALKKWWEDLPSFLKIDASVLPPLSPPSHVVTLNCLYHTFNILLHRPMLSRQCSSPTQHHNRAKHLLECVSSATSIIAIFDLFCKSFGIYRSVLSLSYSVYIASSIFLLQVQAAAGTAGLLTEEQQQQQQPALRKLDFCIRALSRLKDINPIVGSAVGLILRELANLGIHTPGVNTNSNNNNNNNNGGTPYGGGSFPGQGTSTGIPTTGPTSTSGFPPSSSSHHHQPTSSISSDFRARQGSFTGFGHRLSHHEIMMGNTNDTNPGFAPGNGNNGVGGGFGVGGGNSPSRTPLGGPASSLFPGPSGVSHDNNNKIINSHLQHHGISDQVFEAVSSLQPISASFGNVQGVPEHGTQAHGMGHGFRP